MTTRRLLRLALALGLIPTGAVLILLVGSDTSALSTLSRSLGVFVIAAGVVAAFREVVMSRLAAYLRAELGDATFDRRHAGG
jgi:hypothetical protein